MILKPSPPDLQDLYLGSLEAIGIDPALHDLRFVEDDWESPTLGAWGLGWECWCDGMEVSQFTYFQQVAGFDCAPVSRATYGLEARGDAVQGVDNVYKLNFNGREGSRRSPMETMFLQAEQEYSRFNFEFADTEMLKRHFEDAGASACRCSGRGRKKAEGLPDGASAYDQCISKPRLQPLCARRHIRDRAAELYLAGARSGKVLRISLAGDGRRGTRGMTEDSRETRGGLREAGAEGTGRRGGRRALRCCSAPPAGPSMCGSERAGARRAKASSSWARWLPDTGGRAAGNPPARWW